MPWRWPVPSQRPSRRPRTTNGPSGGASAEDAAQSAIAAVLDAEPEPTEPGIARAFGAALAAGDAALIASSMPIRDAESFFRPAEGAVAVRSNRGANGIDGLISTACGIALGSGRPTWLHLGDLAFAHDLGGLASAAALGTPLRILVVDNGGGGIFDFLPQAGQVEAESFGRLFSTPSPVDFEAAAATFDIEYRRLDSEDEIESLQDSGTVIAHLPVERGGNVDLHRRIAEAVAQSLPAQRVGPGAPLSRRGAGAARRA